MINKIKAEIERLRGLDDDFNNGKFEAYKECLKWAEELEKNLKEINFGKRRFRVINDIEKQFHGGGE